MENEATLALLEEKHSTSRLISKRRHKSLPQWATAWLVLIPALIFIILFMFYPILNTFFMAFIQDFSWVTGSGSFTFSNFVNAIIKADQLHRIIPSFGFGNFAKVLGNDQFVQSIWNTFVLVVIEVPLTIIIALLLATFLNSIKALKGLFQTIFFLPYVTNTIALGLVFQTLFSSDSGGIMNILLTNLFGIDPINWLDAYADVPASRFAQGVVIVVYAIWNGLAFKILVFLSGLATIDKQYSDAAKVDGSSSFTIWRRITLPLLSPQILYITITSFIGAFKMYTGVMSVYSGLGGSNRFYFGGKDGYEWMPVVGWIYSQLDGSGIFYNEPGVAAAGSLVLLGIIMIITVIQFAVSSKRVHY